MWKNYGETRTEGMRGNRASSDRWRRPATSTLEHRDELLDGEMLDLYAAILIAVPLALFLKSLWL